MEQYAEVGWLTSRSWVAHCVYPNGAEVARLGAAGVGVAHCPSSNMLLAGGGFAPVRELRRRQPGGAGLRRVLVLGHLLAVAGVPGRADAGQARSGPAGMTAREVLDIGTRGGAGCLGRDGEIGELSAGAAGDLVCWPQEGLAFAGALHRPGGGLAPLRSRAARHTVVAGRVSSATARSPCRGRRDVARHAAAAARIQRLDD